MRIVKAKALRFFPGDTDTYFNGRSYSGNVYEGMVVGLPDWKFEAYEKMKLVTAHEEDVLSTTDHSIPYVSDPIEQPKRTRKRNGNGSANG